MTLAEFLLARIAEEEQIARTALTCSCARCKFNPTWAVMDDVIPELGIEVGHTVTPGYINPEQADHIVRHDPARVLAEVEAKRRIIELHTCRDPDRPDPYCPTCDDTTPASETLYPCTTLRLLALPYADHPDYDQEWRP